MKQKAIKLTDSQAKELYAVAPAEIKELLVSAFGARSLKLDPMSWIKTFEDVEEALGNKVVLPFATDTYDKQEKSVNAFFKLQTIAKVFNEGWVPDFSNVGENKWYPWWKKNAPSGWVFDCSYYFCNGTDLGFGLYFKSKAISDYVAATFKQIYLDYLPE